MNLNSDLPVCIGARSINKDWFGLGLPAVWSVMEDYLHFADRAFQMRVHLFVLMSNHYHMIATFPEGNMAECMQYFQAQTGRQIAKPAGRINHVWRAKYFRSVIGTDHYFKNAYKYIYRNPVEAGICANVEDYPFSTLNGLLGGSKLIVPIRQDQILFPEVDNCLTWLNTRPLDQHREDMRKAIRRRKFKLPRGQDGHSNPLEQILY